MTTTLLPDDWDDIPIRFHERLGDQVGRQRLMIHEGHLLLILHKVPRGNPDQERRGLSFGVILRAVGKAATCQIVPLDWQNI